MKSKEQNTTIIDDLKEVVKSYPIHYIIGTASDTDIFLTCKDAMKALKEGRDEDYNLIGIFNQRGFQLNYEKEFFNYGSEVYDSLCPFHNDFKLGSYKITPSKGMYYCFSCGASGDAISFEQQFYGIGFQEAVYHLAYRLGVISLDQLKDKNFDFNTVKRVREISQLKRNNDLKREEKVELKADFVLVHNFYKNLCEVCGLSDEDKDHLLNVRNIPYEHLENYFTFPSKENEDYVVEQVLIKEFKNRLEQTYKKPRQEVTSEEMEKFNPKAVRDYLQKNLIYTPGFYYDAKRKKIRINNKSGIGLLCENHMGIIEGVQIRNRYTRDGAPRYVWFSSGFASSEDDYKGGSTPGSPGGVVMPVDGYTCMKKILCITEGKFKAEAIAKENCPTIYVSGVSTWKSIKEMVKFYNPIVNEIYIMFDSDMMGNTSVHHQLSQMATYVKKATKKNVYLIVRSKDKGKGYDDLVFNNPDNYKEYIRKIPYDHFEKSYDKVMEFLLNKYDVKEEREIKNPKYAKTFAEQMQYTLEKIYRV